MSKLTDDTLIVSEIRFYVSFTWTYKFTTHRARLKPAADNGVHFCLLSGRHNQRKNINYLNDLQFRAKFKQLFHTTCIFINSVI